MEDDFEKVFENYVQDHRNMPIEDTYTYDMLVNEYMSKCKSLDSEGKNLFPYPVPEEDY